MSGLPVMPERKEVPAWRLLATLGLAGAAAGFLIVFVFGWTEPIIEEYRAEQLRLAVQEVLKEPARYDTLYVVDDALTRELAAGQDPGDLEQIYLGYDADGARVGFAIAAAEPGFQDVIQLIYGYDRVAGAVIGMKVLESKETPGLGDKIYKDLDFVAEFDGAEAPLLGVNPRKATGDPHEIDMITGATISSRTVIKAINNSLERFGPMLDRYLASYAEAGR
jgi:electron transport complex protein RnfG